MQTFTNLFDVFLFRIIRHLGTKKNFVPGDFLRSLNDCCWL